MLRALPRNPRRSTDGHALRGKVVSFVAVAAFSSRVGARLLRQAPPLPLADVQARARGSGDCHTPPFAVVFGAMAAGAAPSLPAYPYTARLPAIVAPGGAIAADAVTPAADVVDVTATRNAAVRREIVAVPSARCDDVRCDGFRRRAKSRGGP